MYRYGDRIDPIGELMEDEEKKTIKEYANTIKEMIDEIRSGEKLHHPNILNQK